MKNHVSRVFADLPARQSAEKTTTTVTLPAMATDEGTAADTRVASLEADLAAARRAASKAERRVTALLNDKKHLLNILDGYERENVHKVSLEKQLEIEQENNRKLRAMIDSVYSKKMQPLNLI